LQIFFSQIILDSADKTIEVIMQIGPASTAIQIAPATAVVAERSAKEREAHQSLAAAVNKLNQSELAGTNREFSISIDPQSRRPIIQIVDSATREVIDQIPSKYILDVAASLTVESSSNIPATGR
jgi:uncharacterized FlaG/YvyC family protein